jgi:hypothetical protein
MPVSTTPRNATPCIHRAAFRLATAAAPHTPQAPWTEIVAENIAPSRPAPAMPLTAQERQLVRLVRASNPNELAAISHETHVKPQDSAEDARFFAPSTPPPTAEVPAEATQEEATPETDQPSPEADSGATSPANQ